ncbi:MAG: hypothetical protein H7641_04260 [Candidatus Heimdallarchaeota archaeon]|nr:hypothetical protein [Candidatus Heimdallarchaeota archaeon]MCK4876775.1 hypothetical protein [Candidatus Heimdallarchaeota archaeon]
MKNANTQGVEDYIQDELFWKESQKEYIKMRGGAEDYSKIKCPTWVTKDPNDSLHLVEFSETIKRLLPHATIVDVPDYLFMHHYPGVKEFGNMIKGYIEETFS